MNREQEELLAAIHLGDHLKVHRMMDGEKIYRLHSSDDNAARTVSGAAVRMLERRGYVRSNLKFPVAAFMLTEEGLKEAHRYTGLAPTPAGPRRFDA